MAQIFQFPGAEEWTKDPAPESVEITAEAERPSRYVPPKTYYEYPGILVHNLLVLQIIAKKSRRTMWDHSLAKELHPNWQDENRCRWVLREEISDNYPEHNRDLLGQLVVFEALGYLESKRVGSRQCFRLIKELPLDPAYEAVHGKAGSQ